MQELASSRFVHSRSNMLWQYSSPPRYGIFVVVVLTVSFYSCSFFLDLSSADLILQLVLCCDSVVLRCCLAGHIWVFPESSFSPKGFFISGFFPGASGPLAPKFCICFGPQLFYIS